MTKKLRPEALNVHHDLELLQSACSLRICAAALDRQQVRDALRGPLKLTAMFHDIYNICLK